MRLDCWVDLRSISNIICWCLCVLSFPVAGAGQYRSDSCGCPRPINDPLEGEGSFGRQIPISDFARGISSDGNRIIYVQGGMGESILDLQTRVPTYLNNVVNIRSVEHSPSIRFPLWSPYDPDLIMFSVKSTIERSDTDRQFYSSNLYTHNLKTNLTQLVNPPFLGEFGPEGFRFIEWKSGSMQGNDTFVIFLPASHSPDKKSFYGLYVPQTGFMQRTLIPYWTSKIQSIDGRHTYRIDVDSISRDYIWPPTVDEIPLVFPHEVSRDQPIGVDFSPNGEYIAFDVVPPGAGPWPDTIHPQVWISKTSDPADPITIVNLQRLYCTYSFAGIFSRFTSDSTLAISMHKDEEQFSPLWEIGIDGRLIRQLTRLDHLQDVKRPTSRERALSINPNPTNGSITIEYESRLSGAVTLSVYSVNGVLVHEEVLAAAPSHKPIQLDASGWPSGAYTIVLKSGDEEARGNVIKN